MKNRVGEDDARTDHDGEGGEQHRTETYGASFDHGVAQRESVCPSEFDEIDEDDRIAHDDASAGHEADHRRCREKRAHRPVRGQDADERKRNRRHHDERRHVALEPSDHQQRDQHKHSGEREAEVTKNLECDMPFAVPFQRGREIVERLVEVVDRQLGVHGAKSAGVQFLDFAVHVKERIGGTLDDAGDIGGDVGDGFQIFAVEVALAGGALDVNEFGERNQ